MAGFEPIVVFVTTANFEEARRIADALVLEKKAACVNIVPGVHSIYRWEGKIEHSDEHLLIVKTRAALFTEVADTIKSLHSYKVPEIIALPIIDSNPDYIAWLGLETEGA